MATIITRTGKGSILTVPEMDSNFRNLNDQILRTDGRPSNIPIFRSDIVNSGVLDPRVTFTRNSTGTYFDKFGVLRTAAAGVPRIDYDPITGECKGLLVEPVATNLLAYSEFNTGAVGSNVSGLISASTMIGPFASTSNAMSISHDGTTTTILYKFTVSANTTYTLSVYVRMTDGNAPTFNGNSVNSISNDFALIIGGLGVYGQTNTYNVVNVGNGLYRVSATITTGTGAFAQTGLVKYNTNSSRTFTTTGWQLEIGNTMTSYIPTAEISVIRYADVVKIPNTFTSPQVTNFASLQIEAKSAKLATNQTYSTIKSDSSPITQKLIKQAQSKNLFTNSENFGALPWVVSNTTVISSTTPNPLTETLSVWKLVDTVASTTHSVYYNLTTGLTINQPYTYSVYAKASGRDFFAIRWNSDTTRDAVFNLTTGAIVFADSTIQATIRNIGSDWYRCAITVRPTSTSSRVDFFTSANSTLATYAGDGVSGTLLFGAQLEAEEKATKYVPEPAYTVQLNSIQPVQSYNTIDEISKFDRFAISTDGSTVNYAANGKIVGSESVTINQISDIVIGSDSSDLNQINGHIQKIALYNTQVTTEQLINLSS